jgi:hypothetical protein
VILRQAVLPVGARLYTLIATIGRLAVGGLRRLSVDIVVLHLALQLALGSNALGDKPLRIFAPDKSTAPDSKRWDFSSGEQLESGRSAQP